MASDNVLRVSKSLNSSPDRQGGRPPILPSTIELDRRPSLSLSVRDFREDDDYGSSDTDKESIDYHVQSPPIPDNQPLDPAISAKVEEQHVSNALFTGGRNSVARAYLMDKVIESEADRPRMAGAKGPPCAMPECDSKAMSDLLPCACDFKICAECFTDAMKIGGGICPGCKEPYKPTDLEEAANGSAYGQPLPLPSPPAMSKGERRLSIMRSLTRSPTGEWDHNRWLFETKGTYGYGNAIWPAEGTGDEGNGQQTVLSNKPWRPLTRKLKIPAAILSPYRYLH